MKVKAFTMVYKAELFLSPFPHGFLYLPLAHGSPPTPFPCLTESQVSAQMPSYLERPFLTLFKEQYPTPYPPSLSFHL